MKIAIAFPGFTAVHGNSVTAERWEGILRELGHEVTLLAGEPREAFDLLIALHARKSAAAVRAFRAAHPEAPVVVALTGTDLYPDLASTGVDEGVLRAASRLVVLQPAGVLQLAEGLRPRARVILQSVAPIPRKPPRDDCFEVVCLAHLRPVKDPLRLAAAVRLLPASSRLRVSHAGAAHTPELADRASAESADNPRWDWLGPLPRADALGLLARGRLLALTSLHEGGANVVSEAIAAGVPVISSRIPGSIGLLGESYPGYFPPGDTEALARLLERAERNDAGLLDALARHCSRLQERFAPARERAAWRDLLRELTGSGDPASP